MVGTSGRAGERGESPYPANSGRIADLPLPRRPERRLGLVEPIGHPAVRAGRPDSLPSRRFGMVLGIIIDRFIGARQATPLAVCRSLPSRLRRDIRMGRHRELKHGPTGDVRAHPQSSAVSFDD
jgi:hypothetical protein